MRKTSRQFLQERSTFEPAMEFPIALESALKALLNHHSISSWKIAGDGPSLAVILRLRPESQQGENHGGVLERVSYRRKPPGQINRDRRRAEEFRQRRENADNSTEQRDDNRREETFANTLNTLAPSENQNNKKGDSVGEHNSQASATVSDTEHATRGREETDTVARDTNEGQGSADMQTDSSSYSENTDSETEYEPSMKGAVRDIVEDLKGTEWRPKYLKQEDRNQTFDRVMIDWRGRDNAKLLCITDDLMATCEFGTGKTSFQLRPEDSYLPFWEYWPEVARDGQHKDMINKLRIEMKAVLNQLRKII